MKGYLIQYQVEGSKRWCQYLFITNKTELNLQKSLLIQCYPKLKVRVLVWERTGEVEL